MTTPANPDPLLPGTGRQPTDRPHTGHGHGRLVTCRDCGEFLADYLDGELPEAQRASFEQHLRKCPPCEAYLTAYQETIRLTKTCCCPDAPDNRSQLPQGLVEAILAARAAG